VFSSDAQTNVITESMEGKFEHVTNFLDQDGKISFSGKVIIWYNDSTAIQEIDMTHILVDSGRTSIRFSVMFYRYLDLRKKIFCDYKTFSDTSKCYSSMPFSLDSSLDNGWSFYSDINVNFENGDPIELGDTIINSIKYKIKRFDIKSKGRKNYGIGYFRCDNPSLLFSLEKPYSKSINCSLQRIDYTFYGDKTPFANTEVKFLSDKLTDKELKVFDAWNKNLQTITK